MGPRLNHISQTNGRVAGFVGGGVESLVCLHNYTNCYVDNDFYDVNQGWLLNGALKYPSYNLVNCGVRRCTIGVNSGGGIDVTSLKAALCSRDYQALLGSTRNYYALLKTTRHY